MPSRMPKEDVVDGDLYTSKVNTSILLNNTSIKIYEAENWQKPFVDILTDECQHTRCSERAAGRQSECSGTMRPLHGLRATQPL
jgi:hypothetical protein